MITLSLRGVLDEAIHTNDIPYYSPTSPCPLPSKGGQAWQERVKQLNYLAGVIYQFYVTIVTWFWYIVSTIFFVIARHEATHSNNNELFT